MFPINNNVRGASKLTAVVVVGCLIWWLSPAAYVSVENLLPQGLQAGVTTNRSKLIKKNARLQTRLAQSRQQRRQLKIGMTTEFASSSLPASSVPASVIARPPTSPYDTLLIDAGSTSNVHRGAAVWWPPGVYLGKVVDVRPHSAVVRLSSSPDVRQVGRLDNKLTVSVVGRGGGMMTATVPSQAEVATGTPVISDRYNAPMGRVVRMRTAPAVGKTRLFIQPIIPASMLAYVNVES